MYIEITEPARVIFASDENREEGGNWITYKNNFYNQLQGPNFTWRDLNGLCENNESLEIVILVNRNIFLFDIHCIFVMHYKNHKIRTINNQLIKKSDD